MHDADMVGFEKCIDGQLPVDTPMQNPRLVVVVAAAALCDTCPTAASVS